VVLASYQTKLQHLATSIQRARNAQNVSLSVLTATASLIALLFFLWMGEKRVPVWCLALTVPVLVAAARWYASNRAGWRKCLRLKSFYERGAARLEDRWHGEGFSGNEFRVANHLYDSDLQILGTGSLFELLCTARTGIGRRRIAQYLLHPCDIAESRARQESVRELTPRSDLRERIALLGKYDFQESTWEIFSEWARTPATAAPLWARIFAFASSATLAALLLAGFLTNIPHSALLALIPSPLLINLGIA
jgi:hypothetical protein